jgi:hypothetical protein
MRPLISIQLLSQGELSLKSVLDSISEQDFEHYEVVLVTTIPLRSTPAIPNRFQVRIVQVPQSTKLLSARHIANLNSTGDFALLLDSTRVLERGCLSELATLSEKFDLVFIKEGSIGSGVWVDLARIDKRISNSTPNLNTAAARRASYILARFFRRTILSETFEVIKTKIGPANFQEVGYGEHHMISVEASQLTERVGASESELLSHHEDSTLGSIIRKYRRYGRSQRTLNKLSGVEYARQPLSHRRNYLGISTLDRIKVAPLHMARSLAFSWGYFFDH